MSQEMRVLHVLAPGREGGLERVVGMLADGQRRRGVHVAAVLTPGDVAGHPFLAKLDAIGVTTTPIVVAGRGYLREFRLLRALIEWLRPAVVHTHGYRADVIAGVVARGCRVPTVSTVHGFTGSGRYTRVYERVQCLALRRADAVIAVSRPLVDRLARAGVRPERIHFVPNGFAPSEQIRSRADARRELGIRDDAKVVAWVGRLSPEKGPDVMLSAIAECDPAWHLSIIGDGPERERLREQAVRLGISNRVTWHGLVADAGSLLTAFDAFVLSSRTEGTPIALFEAMHSGVPIVVTRVGGVPDVVTPDHALLVPAEQPRMIARALEEISREPAATGRRSILARERVLQSYNSEAWLAAVDAIYDGVHRQTARLPTPDYSITTVSKLENCH